MTRCIWPLLAILAFCSCLPGKDTPAQAQELVAIAGGGSFAAPDSTLTLGTRIHARLLQPGDSFRFSYFRNDSSLKVRRWARSWDSLTAVATPPYGGTAVYKGCGQVLRWVDSAGTRVARLHPTPAKCWTWTFKRGPAPTPDPVIDSVVRIATRVIPLVPGGPWALRPGQRTATDSNRAWICAFAVLKSGRRVKVANSINNPVCETAYQAWLASELGNPLTET